MEPYILSSLDLVVLVKTLGAMACGAAVGIEREKANKPAGIAFLGAGTIIRGRGDHIEGLTSAASILFTAAIGIAIAADRYALAVALTAIVVAILHLPRLLARR